MSISGPPAKLAAKVRRISGCGSDQVEELFNRDGMPKEERELKDFLKREKLGLLPSPPPFPPLRPPEGGGVKEGGRGGGMGGRRDEEWADGWV